MSVSVERKPGKIKVVEDNRKHDKDTGSTEVQVALLSDRINMITEHLKAHRTDFSCRRGLLMMVGQRTALLKYLQRHDQKRYHDIVKRLGLRR